MLFSANVVHSDCLTGSDIVWARVKNIFQSLFNSLWLNKS